MISDAYDIVFIGRISLDEIHRFGGQTSMETGGAAFYSSMAACLPGLRIAVVTRVSEDCRRLLDPLRAKGIEVFVQPSAETTRLRVVHDTAGPDRRDIVV